MSEWRFYTTEYTKNSHGFNIRINDRYSAQTFVKTFEIYGQIPHLNAVRNREFKPKCKPKWNDLLSSEASSRAKAFYACHKNGT